MRRFSFTARSGLIAAAVAVASLGLSATAQAIVVDLNAQGQSSVQFNSSSQSGYAGVAMVPGQEGNLASAGVPVVTSTGPCFDPKLPLNMILPATALCSHGGEVMHNNETFAMVWDPAPHKDYASPYVEQYLRDVASASGEMDSPYAITPQYTDATGRAGNASLFGGGYDDQTAYPSNTCTVSGLEPYYLEPGGYYTTVNNDVCLTDSDLKSELAQEIVNNGIIGKVQPGYTPLLTMLMPPGVEVCLNSSGTLCSANSDSHTVAAQFCSYHGQMNFAGREFDYVVLPFVADTGSAAPPAGTAPGCDEPDVDAFPPPTQSISAPQLQGLMGQRLVSPLSQAQIAAITDPGLNGWFGLAGNEINDNGCFPLGEGVDAAKLAGAAYYLQHEFNNGGSMVVDPWAPACASLVDLAPQFVSPSAVDAGDVVQFDGSKSPTTLLVPTGQYIWEFGDGTSATGPSVVHTYTKGGSYKVTLVLVDRGGYLATSSNTVSVLAPSGTPVVAPKASVFSVHLTVMPQSLSAALRSGAHLRVKSTGAADGFVSVTITRAAAKRAHIKVGSGAFVVIGRGTVSKLIKAGTVSLHIHLSSGVAAKLRHLRGVSLTFHLKLRAATGQRISVVAAGSY